MHLNITSTDEMVDIDGVTCRLWVALAPNGSGLHLAIAGIAIAEDAHPDDIKLLQDNLTPVKRHAKVFRDGWGS